MVRIRGNLQQSMCFVFSQKVWKIQPTKMLCEMCQNCIKNFYTSAIESTGGVVKSVTIANEESNQANLHPEENSFTYGRRGKNSYGQFQISKWDKFRRIFICFACFCRTNSYGNFSYGQFHMHPKNLPRTYSE